MNRNTTIFTDVSTESARIFRPYVVCEDSDARIHLQVSGRRKFLFFFLFVLVPVFLICMIPVLFYASAGMPATQLALFSVCVLFTAILLITRRNVHQVVITREQIVVTTAPGTQKTTDITIPVSDVDQLYLRITYGRGGGAMFKLKTKDGKHHEYIVIPILYMTSEKVRAIVKRIQIIMNMHIAGDGLRTRDMVD